jgi:hypothetical protein
MAFGKNDQNENIELSSSKDTDFIRNDEKKATVKGSRYIKYMRKCLSK